MKRKQTALLVRRHVRATKYGTRFFSVLQNTVNRPFSEIGHMKSYIPHPQPDFWKETGVLHKR